MKRFLFLCAALAILGHGESDWLLAQKKKAPPVAVPKLSEIPKVIEQLKDKDPKVRVRAAASLGARGQLRARDIKDAIGPLLEMLKTDADPAARRAAALALSKSDPDPEKIVAPLIEVLKKSKDLTVQAAVATTLGSLGPAAKEAVPVLQETLAMSKGATKAEKDKQALGRAAGAALKQITGKGKKK